MLIEMEYGRNGLVLEVPDSADVFVNQPLPGLEDEAAAIRDALDHPINCQPLSQQIHPGMKVVIVHTDITRATPNNRLLPVILAYLEELGIDHKDITLLNALGTHRRQTRLELKQMLGENIVERYRCIQHDAFDETQLVSLGTSSFGHAITVNRALLDADLKILTGFIEPHFFAGFSGGPKSILPGVAGAGSVFNNHSPEMIAHSNADFLITEGSPIWEEMKEAALLVENTFLVNLTLNRANQITGVFAGDIVSAHQKGCDFVKESSVFPISEPYDVVITSNSGYPLDQSLYQCVKGLAAAKRAVRKGGAVLLVAGCEEGIPDHGAYARLLKEARSPQEILDKVSPPGNIEQDAWQVQIQTQVQMHADCFIYSEGLTDDQIKTSLLKPCRDIPAMIDTLISQNGDRICVLPQGPLTVLDLNNNYCQERPGGAL